MKRLTKSEAQRVIDTLDKVHTALHKMQAHEKRVTATYLKERATELRDASRALDSLANSPFIGIEP